MSRKQKVCDVAKNEHVTERTYIDGPHFKSEGLKDGDQWTGQRAVYFKRCEACDTTLEQLMLTPNESMLGARWNSTHKTFVYPNGGTPQRVKV